MKYELVETQKAFFDEHWCVKITEEGPYAGLIFQYDTIRIEETAEGEPEFHFSTIFVDNPNDVSNSNPELIRGFGEILVDLVEEYLKEQDGENGTADSKESDSR